MALLQHGVCTAVMDVIGGEHGDSTMAVLDSGCTLKPATFRKVTALPCWPTTGLGPERLAMAAWISSIARGSRRWLFQA